MSNPVQKILVQTTAGLAHNRTRTKRVYPDLRAALDGTRGVLGPVVLGSRSTVNEWLEMNPEQLVMELHPMSGTPISHDGGLAFYHVVDVE